MKIYFTSSITGLKDYRKNCEKISVYLKKQDHKVEDCFLNISKEEDLKKTKTESEKVFEYMINRIKGSDLFIGEMSYRSGPVSYQLTYALENEKPTLYLYDEKTGQKPHAVFVGNPSKYLFVRKYNLDNFQKIIDEFLTESGKLMNRRFNFILPADLDDYIAIEAAKQHISKGEFVRSLVMDHRRDNEV